MTTNDRPLVIVLFGATGDLAAKKLLPGLARMYERAMLPRETHVVGAARRRITSEEFRAQAEPAIRDRLWYASIEPDLEELAQLVRKLAGDEGRTMLYLAVPPTAMPKLLTGIAQAGLNTAETPVVVEKPFGHDLASARELDAQLHSVFTEPNIYRIDHFLGKEDVQNILAVRFGSRLFETFWCAEHVDRIEIDVPEAIAVGERGGFYDQVGAYRDMVVTHLFQVLGFLAMEPPRSLSGPDLAAARFAVFDALRPIDPAEVVRGVVDGYRDIAGVAADSDTETFVALRAWIDNDRWRGVPVLMRTGKSLAEGRREVRLRLRAPVASLFGQVPVSKLVLRIGSPGGMGIRLGVKHPGPNLDLQPAVMDLDYGQEPDADDRMGG